ncbi:pyruvate dehydrogenase E2 component (dihydrolipoamide acetyltransferase) [Aminobacter aminovorans]|uniref:Dihydrolipoyllysine-residue acetyltransferase component of acetoin cleaving system n=1 Tax=Aminobacter aminovorans TaxID=83263 RepID=A0A381IM82_AMIAI|nr:acetoin dehydrogenase dihydrolipoyllysine-residue acetyltransferase subunit [Aminobacter aminovorans]TCS21501.1 pyruvate dehydrogenase E2 component (dihydrolipoamide acetyltransferase) [Aminobacter aminovorans]SUY29193.1 Dihydrolipoyllysine-residue acetyltransferase component of acetoin cleaving system [Aminobacter aminovorans]
MPVEVILPKVDMDMATGRISRWYVDEGAMVKKGDLLFEIETDKAAMEIDAPASGIIREISGKEGVDIPVGEAVAWIYAEGEAGKPVKDAPVEAKAAPEVVPAVPVPAAPSALADVSPAKPASNALSNGTRATPLARRLAAEAGLKLDAIVGSGPRGRVMRKDVETAIALPKLEAPAPAKPAPTVSRPPASSQPRSAPQRSAGAAPLNFAWLRQGEGRPIVLIHGFGADLNSWRPMLAAGPVDAPLLALDLPGHGASPRQTPADLDAIACDVEATLTALDVGPLLLVGHSFGAAVAATVAARGHADVRALALIAPAGLGPEINGAFLQGFVRARSEASLMPWLRQLVSDEQVLSKPFVNATLAQATDIELRTSQAEISDRFFADGTQTFDIRGLLAALRIPVRVIVGANDRIIPASQSQGLPGEVALHVFPATGHMPQVERREQVLKILLEMVRA